MEKTKNILFGTLTILALISGYGVISYVNTYSKSVELTGYRYFSVSAEGKVVGTPDIARFSFGIISEGSDLAKVQKENTERANNAIKFLKENGIEEKDIKTTGYYITPKYTYYECQPSTLPSKPCPPPTISSYTITQSIMVKIRDFSKIGNILSGIVEYGVNDVSNLTFAIDDLTDLENKARQEAIKKAKEKAQNIAQAVGFKLGDILSVEEGYYSPRAYYDESFREIYASAEMGGGAPISRPAPQIEPGTSEVKVTVTLKYKIK